MEEWGECLKNKNVDIFDVIGKVIKVAARDNPNEFLRRRDEIAHCLYWCEFNEEEKRRVGEVLRIKAILEKHGDCGGSVSVVYESLKKLQKMGLSFKVVDAAGIGNTVSRLQDHASKEVKQIAEMIIGSWMRRAMLDRWVDSFEKMPALHQEDEQGGELKNDVILPAENQTVRETRKSLKVRIKVIRVQDESTKANVLDGAELKIGYKDTGVDEVLTSVPKGRDEQRVKLINSNGTMEEKLEAARRKLREAKNSVKKRSIQFLQSWEVNTLLPPESQQMKRFRR